MNKSMPKLHFLAYWNTIEMMLRNVHFFKFKIEDKIFHLTKSTKNMLNFCGLLRAIISRLTSINVDGKIAGCYNI